MTVNDLWVLCRNWQRETLIAVQHYGNLDNIEYYINIDDCLEIYQLSEVKSV